VISWQFRALGCAAEWGAAAPVWYKLPAITQELKEMY